MNRATLQILVTYTILLTACLGPVEEYHDEHFGLLELRIEKRYELGFMGHTVFILKARNSGDKKWDEVTTFLADDPIDIPRDNLKLINPKTVMFFFNEKFVVSTDLGGTWSLWDTTKDIKPGCPYASWIKTVTVDENGSGVMTVECPSNTDPNTRLFNTVDSGKTWNFVKFQ